jgi:hypothetical protein
MDQLNDLRTKTMPLFRKKPVTIEARQFIHHGDERLAVKFAIIDWIRSHGGTAHPQDDSIRIATLEGDHLATHGDWIIRGVKGEFYPCKPDIFALTYEDATSGSYGQVFPAIYTPIL